MYRNPILIKAILFITIFAFSIASLSPEFMFSVVGFTNMEPFVISAYQYCFSVGPTELRWNPEHEGRELGIFTMFILLLAILIFYFLYQLIKRIYSHFKTSKNAINN